MKKTLIALALASLPVAAMADVTLYGQLKAGVEAGKDYGTAPATVYVDGKKQTADKETDAAKQARTQIFNWTPADLGSRFGIKGSHDLGNGLKGIWQVESQVHVGGAGALAARNTFLGLDLDGVGSVKVGHIDTPYSDAAETLDTWEYDDGDLGLVGIADDSFAAADRQLGVRVDTADFMGLSASAFYNFNVGARSVSGPATEAALDVAEKSTADEANYPTRSRAVLGFGVNYENSDLHLFANYATALRLNEYKSNDKTGKDATYLPFHAHTVALGYNDPEGLFLGVGGNIRSGTYNVANKKWVLASNVGATVGYNVAGLLPKLSVAAGFSNTFAYVDSKEKAQYSWIPNYVQVLAGVDYNLGEQTTVGLSAGWKRNIGYGSIQDDKNYSVSTNDRFVGGLQLVHRF